MRIQNMLNGEIYTYIVNISVINNTNLKKFRLYGMD
jgi:hypothetical protein